MAASQAARLGSCRRLDHHGNRGRRDHDNSRTRRGNSACRSLGDHRPGGGREAMAGGAGGRTTMGGAERGWGTILRGSGRAGAAGGGGNSHGRRWCWPAAGAGGAAGGSRRRMRPCRASSSSSCFLARMAFSTSPGLEICERSILGAMPCGARDACALAWPAGRDPRSKCARTLSASSVLQRTGVGLAGGQAELRQYVENLPALDFHLAREIVDSNLTHPPLFKLCCPKPLVAHSYLMALAVLENFRYRLIGLERRGASYAPSSLAACSSVVPLSVSVSSGSSAHRRRGRSPSPLRRLAASVSASAASRLPLLPEHRRRFPPPLLRRLNGRRVSLPLRRLRHASAT